MNEAIDLMVVTLFRVMSLPEHWLETWRATCRLRSERMGTFAQGNNVIGAGDELVRAMAGRERGREAYCYYLFFVFLFFCFFFLVGKGSHKKWFKLLTSIKHFKPLLDYFTLLQKRLPLTKIFSCTKQWKMFYAEINRMGVIFQITLWVLTWNAIFLLILI